MVQKIEEELWEEFNKELNKASEVRIKYTSVLSPEHSKNLQKFWDCFLEEKWPQGEINKTLEKNFAIYIINQEVDFATVKEKYLAQGWNPQPLSGWIKMVLAGEITELNIGELVLWARKNKPNMLKFLSDFNEAPLHFQIVQKEEVEIKNPFKQLHYSTDHLPLFHEFETIVSLYGRHYIPILKTRWYQFHGGIIQKVVKLGNLTTDTRVQACYPLVTEGGKNEIIYSIKRLIKKGIPKDAENKFVIAEPVSFHQESLIGKRVERMVDNPLGKPKKIKVKIENRGHLDSDFVEFDECNQLITSSSPDFQQAREYLSKAENPIGMNNVEKRSVDDLPEETVSYCPNSTHSYYFQPFKKLPESFVLQGFGRRKLIPVGSISSFLVPASETLYNRKLQGLDFSEEEYEERLINHLTNVRQFTSTNDFSFTDKAIEKIREYALYITGQAELHSEKISNFAKVSKWTSLANLVKFSCILAGAYHCSQVNENHVALAFFDIVELMQNTYDFISERIKGDFDYGITWGGADSNQRECLKFLYNHEFISRDTSAMTINEFVNKVVAKVYKVAESQARNRYLEMKEAKLIDSAQVGKTTSRVWIKINPDHVKMYGKGDKGIKGYNAYNSIFLAKKDIIGGCNP